MYYESNNVKLSDNEYAKNVLKLKEEQLFKKEKLININDWPDFEDFSFCDLREISLDLMSELEDREISFIGVSVDKDKESEPILYIYMDRISRTYHESEDIPETFEGFVVKKIIAGKFNF